MEPEDSLTDQPENQRPPEAVEGQTQERGQGMVEYVFILMVVFLVVILSVQVLGHQTQHLYSNVSNAFVGH